VSDLVEEAVEASLVLVEQQALGLSVVRDGRLHQHEPLHHIIPDARVCARAGGWRGVRVCGGWVDLVSAQARAACGGGASVRAGLLDALQDACAQFREVQLQNVQLRAEGEADEHAPGLVALRQPIAGALRWG
jgi:hypothetical protein